MNMQIPMVRIQRNLPSAALDVWLMEKIGDNQISIAEPIKMKKLEPFTYATERSFQIGQTGAQVLMDDLWNCGIRPTEGAGTAGAMAATQEHLKDLRKLLFHTMKVQ